jgi:hypothetical protein
MITLTYNRELNAAVAKFHYDPALVDLIKSIGAIPHYESGKFAMWKLALTEDLESRLPELESDKRFEVDPTIKAAIETARDWKVKNLELANTYESKEEPETIEGINLTRYQQTAFDYVTRNLRGVILNDPENMDRIKVAMSALNRFGSFPGGASVGAYPILIVCHVGYKGHWTGTIKTMYPNKTTAMLSSNKPYTGEIKDIHITAYNNLEKQFDYIKSVEWGGIIFDSCEMMKNEKPLWSQIADYISKNISKKIFMSGFDLTSDPEGLINILKIAGQLDEFGGFWSFANKFCKPKKTQYGWDLSGKDNPELLRKMLSETCYIRRV